MDRHAPKGIRVEREYHGGSVPRTRGDVAVHGIALIEDRARSRTEQRKYVLGRLVQMETLVLVFAQAVKGVVGVVEHGRIGRGFKPWLQKARLAFTHEHERAAALRINLGGKREAEA